MEPNKLVTQLTVNEALGLIKKAAEISSEVEGISQYLTNLQDFFGVDRGRLRKLSITEGQYKWAKLLLTFVPFMESRAYSVCRHANYDDDLGSGYFPGYDVIELDPGVHTNILDDGSVFLSTAMDNSLKNIVLTIHDYGSAGHNIQLIYAESDQDKARQLFDDWEKYSSENNPLVGKKLDPSLKALVVDAKYTWETISLPDQTKADIYKNTMGLLEKLDVYKHNKVKFKRGILLEGPPGTGKTHLAKILCNSIPKGVSFIWATPKHLDEGKSVAEVIELARGISPSVLFLEDIDLYGTGRGTGDDSVLGELMNQLDGLIENEFMVVVATTNCPEKIEEAVRNRPGRFDRVIHIGKPDYACRRKILLEYSKGFNFNVPDIAGFLDILADKTDGFTGAHLKDLASTAVMDAVEENSVNQDGIILLKSSHFLDNIDIVKAKEIQVGFIPEPTNRRKRREFNPFDD